MELSADGRTFKDVSSFSKFVNVPELIALYAEIADTKTADMLNLPRPDVVRRDGKPGFEIVEAEPSAQEEAGIQALVAEAERWIWRATLLPKDMSKVLRARAAI